MKDQGKHIVEGNPEIKVLLDLLAGREEFSSLPEEFDEDRLMKLILMHKVSYQAMLYARQHEGFLSSLTLNRLETKCRQIALHALTLLQELIRIVREFQAARIPFAVIKGPQLARMLYGREALKESVDIDLMLVHQADLAKAHDVLSRLGYKWSTMDAYHAGLKRKVFLIAKREVQYTSPASRCTIDLHARPGANAYLTAGRFRELLTTLVPFDLEGTPVMVLPDEAYFVYLCYHGALHQFSRLAWLMDIRAFLQVKKNTLDYEAVRNIARTLRAERPVGLAVQLLEDYFGDEIPKPLTLLVTRSHRMRFLVSNCRDMIGRDEQYGLSLGGRFGKLLYMMVMIRGMAGKIDLLYGIMVRVVAGWLKA